MAARPAPAGIPWLEWGAAPFERARSSGRPVLLRLTAFWCHWCRVMEEHTDSDPRVANAVTERFVPVVVDIDKRPDLKERYTMGGYPTSAVLAVTGEVLTGANYLPADEFLRFLEAGLAAHRAGGALLEAPRPTPAGSAAHDADPSANLRAVERAVLDEYDWANHGFGLEPKFPQPGALLFLLASGLRSGLAHGQKAALLSLSAMPKTEIYDAVDGGFFRCCDGAKWKEPHVEKLLETNAQMLHAYSVAFAWAGRPEDRRVAAEVAAYLERGLTLPDTSLWGGSQAPDEEYYAKMRHARGTRGSPPVDPTVYTDWNAQAISAFAVMGICLHEGRMRARARFALRELLDAGAQRGGDVFHYRDGNRWSLPGLLRDRVALGTAALDVYCATGEARWLTKSLELAEPIPRAFAEADAGAPLYSSATDATSGEPTAPRGQSLRENSEAATLLFRLAAAACDDRLAEAARGIVASVAPAAAAFGVFAAPLGLAMLAARHGVVVVEAPDGLDERTAALARSAIAGALALGPVTLRTRPAADGEPAAVAYCVRDKCSVRARDEASLPRALRDVANVAEAL